MKRAIQIILTMVFSGGLASMATAAPILVDGGSYDETDVGVIDTFLAATEDLENSNPDTETSWVNSILGGDPTVTYQVKDEEDIPYYATSQTGVYAFFMLPPPSSYFVIKNAQGWALFENLVDLDWGVFDEDDLPAYMNLASDSYTVSHVTRFTSEGSDGPEGIPEPATLALLGVGLLGLGAATRRRRLI